MYIHPPFHPPTHPPTHLHAAFGGGKHHKPTDDAAVGGAHQLGAARCHLATAREEIGDLVFVAVRRQVLEKDLLRSEEKKSSEQEKIT